MFVKQKKKKQITVNSVFFFLLFSLNVMWNEIAFVSVKTYVMRH